MNDLTRKVINVALFQAAWFAAVLGTARGMLWLGPVAMIPTLAIHLVLQENRRGEVKLLLAAGCSASFLTPHSSQAASLPRCNISYPALSVRPG